MTRATGWYAHAPNALTLLRLVLASAFFACLAMYRFPTSRPWLLIVAALLFVAAALTDALDGYLARRWHAETAFGRIMDPFADKVLVLGAFVFLAGPNFVAAMDRVPLPWTNLSRSPVSGVDPWMVVVILARELLVTSMRGVLEAHGVRFGAEWAGKAKMVLQSAAVPCVLVVLWLGTTQRSWTAPGDGTLPLPQWCRWSIDAVVRATVLVTALSAVPYILRGWREARRLVIREDGTHARGPSDRTDESGSA